jgi:hypothetical protein
LRWALLGVSITNTFPFSALFNRDTLVSLDLGGLRSLLVPVRGRKDAERDSMARISMLSTTPLDLSGHYSRDSGVEIQPGELDSTCRPSKSARWKAYKLRVLVCSWCSKGERLSGVKRRRTPASAAESCVLCVQWWEELPSTMQLLQKRERTGMEGERRK